MGQLRQYVLDEDTVAILRAALTEARDEARRNAKFERPTYQPMWLDWVARYDKALEQIMGNTENAK